MLKYIKQLIVNRYLKSVEKRNLKALEKVKRKILIDEFKLIQKKRSNFTKSQRDHVLKKVMVMVKDGEINAKELKE